VSSVGAFAQVVVPSGQTNSEGNSNNGFPFNYSLFSLGSQRYQQVYSSAEFTGGPVMITGMTFRPDAFSGGAFASTLNLSISLSTTAAAVDALSMTFANNIGADATVVRSGSINVSSAFTGPGSGPKDFDIFISFTNSFLYDPSMGNLLLDVSGSGTNSSTQFDSHNAQDGTSRIYTSGSGSGSATADFADSEGLVTRFNVQPVPEPATMAALGIGALALLRKRKKSA
jgi:hypothetical protein